MIKNLFCVLFGSYHKEKKHSVDQQGNLNLSVGVDPSNGGLLGRFKFDPVLTPVCFLVIASKLRTAAAPHLPCIADRRIWEQLRCFLDWSCRSFPVGRLSGAVVHAYVNC